MKTKEQITHRYSDDLKQMKSLKSHWFKQKQMQTRVTDRNTNDKNK